MLLGVSGRLLSSGWAVCGSLAGFCCGCAGNHWNHSDGGNILHLYGDILAGVDLVGKAKMGSASWHLGSGHGVCVWFVSSDALDTGSFSLAAV